MKEQRGSGAFVLRSPHAVCELVKPSKRNKDGVLIAELKGTIWVIKLNYLVLGFNLWIHHLNFIDFLTMEDILQDSKVGSISIMQGRDMKEK